MEFGSFGGGRDDEDNGIGFREVSQMSTLQDHFVLGTAPFDRLKFSASNTNRCRIADQF